LVVVAATALSGLGLAACSGDDQTPDGTDTASGADQVTLEFWDMAWGPADTYPAAAQKLVEQFEDENPGIKVNYTNKSWDNWYQTFAQAVGAGSAPDVSTGGGFQPFGLQQDADAILPLNDLIDQWQSDGTADDFTEGMLDYYKDANGDYLAVPWATDIRVWFYRADLLEQAGLSVPTTWEEFAQACDQAHQVLGPDVYGIADGGTPHWTFMQGISFGAGMFDANGDAALTSEKELAALEYISSMGQGGTGCINPTATTISQDEAITMMDDGKAVFVMDSPTIYPRLTSSLANVKVLPPLANADGDKLGLYFVNGIMAYKAAEERGHAEAALKFVEFWSANGLGLFQGGASGVSPRESIVSDSMFDDMPLYREAAELWGAPVGQPLYALAPSGFAALNTIDGDDTMLDLERALFNGSDVAAAAQVAQDKVQGFIDEGR
jgi:multiple sugar transport system substrate-binding protein